MAAKQRFSEYEAVILLEGLLDYLDGKLTKKDAVRRVSNDLRTMAVNQGQEIDDSFRNEGGIRHQIERMHSAYVGYTIHEAAPPHFVDMVDIYRSSRATYSKLLKEAKQMIHPEKTVETLFTEYLASKVSPAQLSELYMCYSEIEAFGKKLGILKKSLFETVESKTVNRLRVEIEQNKVFRMTHKKEYTRMVTAIRHYYTFIRDIYKPAPKKTEELQGEQSSQVRQAPVTKKREVPADNTTGSDHKTAKQTKPADGAIFAIDFTGIIDLSYTKPVSLSYFGEEFSSFSSWKDLYVRFIGILCDDYPAKFFAGMKFSDSDGRIELTNQDGATAMVAAKAIPGTTYFAETNISASSMGTKMKYILDLCGVDYENVVIRYAKRTTPSTVAAQTTTQKPVAASQKTAAQNTNTPTAPAPPASLSRKNNRSSFENYLVEIHRYERSTVSAYGGAILASQICARRYGYLNWRLFDTDVKNALGTLKALLKDKRFTQQYLKKNTVVKTAVKVLEQFLNWAGEPAPKTKSASTAEPKKPVESKPFKRVPAEEEKQPTSSASSAKSFTPEAFKDYLLHTLNLGTHTVYNYIKAINRCEMLAQELGYETCSLYTPDMDAVMDIIRKLRSEPQFIQINKSMHNSYTAALGHYTTYISAVLGGSALPKAAEANKLQRNSKEIGVPQKKTTSTYTEPTASLSEALTPEDWVRFDMNNAELFRGTVPINCSVAGQSIDGKNWRDILANLADLELKNGNPAMDSLRLTSLTGRAENPFLMASKPADLNCIQLSNGYWVMVQLNIPQLIGRIKNLALHCGYSPDQIILFGTAKKGSTTESKPEKRIVRENPEPASETVASDFTTAALGISRDAFYQTLIFAFDVAEVTAGNYARVISKCERYAMGHYGNSYLLYTQDKDVAIKTIDRLLSDQAFFDNYKSQMFILRSALTKFRQFVSGDVTAPGTDLTTPIVKKRSSSTEATPNTSPAINELSVKKAESLVLESDLDGTTDATISSVLGLTMVATKALIAKSKVLVEVNGKVYHQDAFIDWEDGANQLTDITEKLMQKNDGYISSSQLYDYARMDMHMFLSDNDMNSERAVYDIAQHLFEKIDYSGKHYSFSGKMHISNKEKTIGSNLDVVVQYALDQGGFFSMEELKDHLTGIGVKTGNIFGQMKLTTEPKFFYYENGVLVLAESMGIDDTWKATLSSALESLFNDVGDHIILRDIQPFWFDNLPKLPMGKHWTPLLLQSVLRFFSDELGARTIGAMNTQAIDTLHTMLVQSESNIQNFGDAVIAYLLENDVESRTFVAEDLRQLLVQSGMIQGNELIWNMPKALSGDSRFSWDASEKQVTILV